MRNDLCKVYRDLGMLDEAIEATAKPKSRMLRVAQTEAMTGRTTAVTARTPLARSGTSSGKPDPAPAETQHVLSVTSISSKLGTCQGPLRWLLRRAKRLCCRLKLSTYYGTSPITASHMQCPFVTSTAMKPRLHVRLGNYKNLLIWHPLQNRW